MKTGDYLGDLTDELEEFGAGSYIEEFFSSGSKYYAFSIFCPSTEKRTSQFQVNSITLNYENSMVVTFTTLRTFILEDDTPLMYTIPKDQEQT